MSTTHLLPDDPDDFLFGAYLHRNSGRRILLVAENLGRGECHGGHHVIFCIKVLFGLVDNDVLDDRGSVDGGTALFVIVPLAVIVKVHGPWTLTMTASGRPALIRSKRSRGEKA